jgi:aminoglycoside/choline kinase family phosphotransferase
MHNGRFQTPIGAVPILFQQQTLGVVDFQYAMVGSLAFIQSDGFLRVRLTTDEAIEVVINSAS